MKGFRGDDLVITVSRDWSSFVATVSSRPQCLGIGRFLIVGICAAALALAGCGRSRASNERHSHVIVKPILQGNRRIGEIGIGTGVACYVDGRIGPPSYDVNDIGKRGTPALKPSQSKMLHDIMVYVHPSTLRFGFVANKFIVFDAINGPCAGMNYFVLNGDCNEFYSPTDDFDGTRAGTGCWNPPRPWISNDRGTGTWSWHDYPNKH